MVRIEENKLVIEINHPSPDEFKKDLKDAIINSMQNQHSEGIDPEELGATNYTLLELLKNIE
jgi:hypothetical protein